MHIANYFKEKYGVSIGRTTIGDILSNADKYFDYEKIRAHGCKRLKNPEQIHLEKALYMWYSEARTHNLPISDLILISKAQQIGEIIGVDILY